MRAVAGSVAAEHLTLLDGRTLNVCVRLPEAGAGRTAAWLRAGDRALRLEVAGERAFGTYVVEPVACGAGRGRRGAAGAGHGLEVIAVEEGEARELRVEWAAGRRRRRGYGLAAVPAVGEAVGAAAGPGTGPTRPDPPHPDGWRVTVTSPAAGCPAVLRAERLPPHAEVDRVEVGWTELAIHGRVVGLARPGVVAPRGGSPGGVLAAVLRGAAPAAPAPGPPSDEGLVAELVMRGEGGTVCRLGTTECGGGRFVAAVAGRELAKLAEWSGERTWDLRVRAGGCALPGGRLLGDVVDPGRVHRLPNRLLVADSGAVVRTAPGYTPAGRLILVTEVVGDVR
ncbi:hypothetical protein O7599_25825 [Streptomyces sp. WMMC500]|uniref:hypothetical protein n=1 Tax=Streptomyces sp. WMMC500 TaxID=3015154 RepID=UPI00248CF8D0|nr:hypothetical protein [Streptomyces sp. WMMC500]WBB59005.1 hypothetical protein O7599_25825 [Streptomyces sp. WMMC500]